MGSRRREGSRFQRSRGHRSCHLLNPTSQRVWCCHSTRTWLCRGRNRLSPSQGAWIIQISSLSPKGKRRIPRNNLNFQFVWFVLGLLFSFLSQEIESFGIHCPPHTHTHTHTHTPSLSPSPPSFCTLDHFRANQSQYQLLGHLLSGGCVYFLVWGYLPAPRDKNWMMLGPEVDLVSLSSKILSADQKVLDLKSQESVSPVIGLFVIYVLWEKVVCS